MPPGSHADAWSPWLLGAATLIVPLAIGALLGRIARGRLPLVPRVIVVVALIGAPFLVAGRIPISIYDQLLMTLAAAVAFAVSASPSPSARLSISGTVVAVGIAAVGAALVEVVAGMVLLPSPARPTAPEELHFVFRPADMDFSCRALDWQPAGDEIPVGGKPLRVFLGDSMVAALDVQPEQRFTRLVAKARPSEQLLPMGFGGIGPDAYLYLAEHQVQALHPDEVVLFVYLGNDPHDIDQPHPCCLEETILDYPAGEAHVRCDPRVPRIGLRQKLRLGPAPFLLRLLAPSSLMAERIASLWEVALRQGPAWQYLDWAPQGDQLDHTVAALRALAAHLSATKIPLRVVLLPPRWSLQEHQPDDPFPAVHERIARDLRASGIALYDAWSLLQAAVDRDPSGDWFIHQEGNPHLGPAGHALVADWLLRDVLPPAEVIRDDP